MAIKMFISAKPLFKVYLFIPAVVLMLAGFSFVKQQYRSPDFGKTFGSKFIFAREKLSSLSEKFKDCSALARQSPLFMQSMVAPEVMRYNHIKDGIEAESLRTLYVELGSDYANFSIGLFQMKPSFAAEVEQKAVQTLSPDIQEQLQLGYTTADPKKIRQQRVERLLDEDWQLVYLTAFTCLCNKMYADIKFNGEKERLQWYATVYNAGFNRSEDFLIKKMKEENFYLGQGMPGKKFRYAAVAGWFYDHEKSTKTEAQPWAGIK